MSDVKLDAKIDLNTFTDQAYKIAKSGPVGSATIYNNTDKAVTFSAYNYIDLVFVVAAQSTLVAPDYYGTVACSGSQFKIHPNKRANQEFVVKPGSAWVYSGPGKVAVDATKK